MPKPRAGNLASHTEIQTPPALEEIILSPALTKATTPHTPFPKRPPFRDVLHGFRAKGLEGVLNTLEASVNVNFARIEQTIHSLKTLDEKIAADGFENIPVTLVAHIDQHGWSHAILRKVVLAREFIKTEDEKIEALLWEAGLHNNNVVITSLIHCFALEQNYLSTKRSVLNLQDRGPINQYSRSLVRLAVQPFSKNSHDLAEFLGDVSKCSLIDALILAKLNSHLYDESKYPKLANVVGLLGSDELLDKLLKLYDPEESYSEYSFYKQSSAWLEYSGVRGYRMLVDTFYDASGDAAETPSVPFENELKDWILEPTLSVLTSRDRLTKHRHSSLARLEQTGNVTRSAMFNFWLSQTEGQVGFEQKDLLTLMGLTRDLDRTVPIVATRTAARLTKDRLVKFILLLLLAKRSKNERDSFHLRKLIEEMAIGEHGGSLLSLIKSFESAHRDISVYIYEITTEEFLAKLSQLVPHLSDIPDTRAALHEWMAQITGEPFYQQRARAVRIDHQLNRVRGEIDDNRIYVDPSRFSSWINDEVMVDINSALTTAGTNKKVVTVNCDEALLSAIVQECYLTFCSNAVFGVSSYIGRRIRHGTFRGHLYSSMVNQIEAGEKYKELSRDPGFLQRWGRWKQQYDSLIKKIINERLHIVSKQKSAGLLQPDMYNPHKQDILSAAVKRISVLYTETKSTETLDQVITEYCWRLAEVDLQVVISYLKSQQTKLKQLDVLEEIVSSLDGPKKRLASEFKRELMHSIDNRMSAMYGWFKKPSNVSPRASLANLYNAVVAEVQDSIPTFNPSTESSDMDDIELIGGVYHVLYDSFYVIIVNAARYGDQSKPVKRSFSIAGDKSEKRLVVEITSAIRPGERPEHIAETIEERKAVSHEDATLYDQRSGIPKIMQLAHTHPKFEVEFYGVIGNDVVVRFSHALAH